MVHRVNLSGEHHQRNIMTILEGRELKSHHLIDAPPNTVAAYGRFDNFFANHDSESAVFSFWIGNILEGNE